ncbi:MAG: sugar kinase [Turicibacter sp.]|nr:sugar kinase [Turicibacter sp.]
MNIASFGEVMLRLTPPNFMVLEQTDQLTMSFVGTGVNLLGSLSRFGQKTSMVSKIPNNALGLAALSELRKLGIGTEFMGFSGDHMGSFFVELGYGLRPTQVTYQNRVNSSFCQAGAGAYGIEGIVSQSNWVHICGITLSLTKQTREAALKLAKETSHQGKNLCFDFNYRPSLNEGNTLQEMRGYYQEMLRHATLVFGSLRDLTDLMGMEINKELPPIERLRQGGAAFMKEYDIPYFAGTIRNGHQLTGFIFRDGELHLSQPVELKVLDRIGGGDAYAAGILHGLASGWETEYLLKFAVANAALAHSTFGDTPLATENQVKQFMDNPTLDLVR